MPSLIVASVAFMRPGSLMFSVLLKLRMCGSVASPTPTVPISSDSTSRMETGRPLNLWESAAAVIHPAVPPPRMHIRSICMDKPATQLPFAGLSECGVAASGLHLRANLRRGGTRREDFRSFLDPSKRGLVALAHLDEEHSLKNAGWSPSFQRLVRNVATPEAARAWPATSRGIRRAARRGPTASASACTRGFAAAEAATRLQIVLGFDERHLLRLAVDDRKPFLARFRREFGRSQHRVFRDLLSRHASGTGVDD